LARVPESLSPRCPSSEGTPLQVVAAVEVRCRVGVGGVDAGLAVGVLADVHLGVAAAQHDVEPAVAGLLAGVAVLQRPLLEVAPRALVEGQPRLGRRRCPGDLGLVVVHVHDHRKRVRLARLLDDGTLDACLDGRCGHQGDETDAHRGDDAALEAPHETLQNKSSLGRRTGILHLKCNLYL
jgi:hypothetical protein